MSTEFTKAVSICIHSTVDLFAGFGFASLINTFFTAHQKNSTQIQRLGSILAQACISMLVGESFRRLAWANPEDDPSGGIMFILSLGQQPMLWANLTGFFDDIGTNFLADSNNNANPDSNV